MILQIVCLLDMIGCEKVSIEGDAAQKAASPLSYPLIGVHVKILHKKPYTMLSAYCLTIMAMIKLILIYLERQRKYNLNVEKEDQT